MIFHEAAKIKIIAQAGAVASAPLANKMVVSERAPCCREALLEGSYCNCSNWSLSFVCVVEEWVTQHRKQVCLSCLVPVRVFGKIARKVLYAVLPACFWCLLLSCVPQTWDSCFPSMLSDKKKKACVWRLEYGLNHASCDSEGWALNCRMVEEFRSFGVFLKQECKWLWYLSVKKSNLHINKFKLLCVKMYIFM